MLNPAIPSANSYSNMILQVYNSLDWTALIRAAILIIMGFLVAYLVRSTVLRVYHLNSSGRHARLIGKLTYFPILFIFLISAIRTMGFDLQVLLGATGILTVALGFASQTSVSNLVSGLFLVTERSFVVGDTINVNGTTGEVLAVDLLSVKLRQKDNTMVRIPNEILIKTQIINLSRFPTRRFDCILSVSAQSDIAKIRNILLKQANGERLCLQNPLPFLEVQEITDTAVHLQFSVWAMQENYTRMKNIIQEKILNALNKEGIMVASPSTLIQIADMDKPLPIKLYELNSSITKQVQHTEKNLM